MKNLILYFSRPGENYVSGDIIELEKGNSEIVAEKLSELIDADMVEVKTVKDYPNNYNETVERAKDEFYNQKYPELINPLNSIEDYENIYILGPIWCGHFPMPLLSQLKDLDFSDKNIFPIVTHEGSGLAAIMDDLKNNCKGAMIKPGLSIFGHDSNHAENDLEEYLNL